MALMSVEDAIARILHGVKPLASEAIALTNAFGRVTAGRIVARRDQPPFMASAMDGYAVRHVDVATLPSHLTVTGIAAAGRSFKGKVKPGQAIRILTGAPVPADADTVVIQENTTRDGDRLIVTSNTAMGKNIRRRGLDFVSGDVLVEAGTELNARTIGLAAAGNAPRIRVRKRPHVVVLATGDELVLPGQKPRSDQIVSSNSHALEAIARAWGANVTNLGIVKDDLRATERAIRKGLAADVLITTGGASVGDHDFVQQALKNCGVKIGFWKIALRPGKPLMFGTMGRTRVLGLPGNPVSALVCSRLFLRPLLRALEGKAQEDSSVQATLCLPLPVNDNRKDYIRATMTVAEDGTRLVKPFAMQDSSMQRTLARSDCLIIREPFAPAAGPGDKVRVLILDF